MDNFALADFLTEESYKDLFDNAHDLIQIVDLEGRILYANRAWTKTLGYELEEIHGQSIYSFIDKDDKVKFQEHRAQIINEEIQQSEIVITYENKTGKKISLEGSVSVRKKHGKPVYTRGIFRDITQKLQDDARLREREYNLQQLLYNAPDAIVVIDEQSRVTYWNPQAEKLFGWTAHEAVNQPLSAKIIPAQHREAHERGMNRYLTTGEVRVLNKTIEITAINKAGEEFFVSLTISTTSLNGKRAFIAFIRDIREQKKNQAELEGKRQELEVTNQQLEQFAHVASHDMKEPIRKVLIFTGRLRDQLGAGIDDKAGDYLEKVQKAAHRLQSMVEGFLNYATASSIKAAFVTLDLNKIVHDIVDDLDLLIEQKKALIRYKNLPSLFGDQFLIYQLFYNLILNSLKFGRQDPQLTVDITARELTPGEAKVLYGILDNGSFVEIKIKDNGIGFNPRFASEIFKTFTRLNKRSDYEGTGLGLSLCKNIMERHDGYIIAEGHEGEGAIFTVLFPVNTRE